MIGEICYLAGVNIDQGLVAKRLGQYEAATTIVRRLLPYGMYWRGSDFAQTAVKSITRIASSAATIAGGLVLLLRLRSYPLSLLFYASSLGALAAGDYKSLRKLFEVEVPHQTNTSKKTPAVLELYPGAALPEELLKLVGKTGRTPASDRIFGLLREDFRELLPDDDEYSVAQTVFSSDDAPRPRKEESVRLRLRFAQKPVTIPRAHFS